MCALLHVLRSLPGPKAHGQPSIAWPMHDSQIPTKEHAQAQELVAQRLYTAGCTQSLHPEAKINQDQLP